MAKHKNTPIAPVFWGVLSSKSKLRSSDLGGCVVFDESRLVRVCTSPAHTGTGAPDAQLRDTRELSGLAFKIHPRWFKLGHSESE